MPPPRDPDFDERRGTEPLSRWHGRIEAQIENAVAAVVATKDEINHLRAFIQTEVAELRSEVLDLRLWRARLIGMAAIISFVTGLLGTILVEFVIRRLGAGAGGE